jgi:palmitoyltransferase ZDHHC9/14/18
VPFVLQTTYENFRYRADGRINVFNQGCLNNFLEVFCTEIRPSRNNFRAFVQEEVQRPLTTVVVRGREPNDLDGDRRPKVEDDLDIGEDLLKISQRRNVEELGEDIRSRGNNGAPYNTSEPDSILSSDHRATTIRSDARHSSWERNGNWEIAQDAFANSNVTESRNYVTSKEIRQ